MIIELTRKHAVLFISLIATQWLGLWFASVRSPVLAGMPRSIWACLFLTAPGSAFLATVIIIELLRVLGKRRL